ncbi:MAG TPA: hypothetical protein VKQ34_02245 [Candidatus Saccharimonadales bacterium]|nr:hypothetical protein [Candidatus Saccharimonadales bacterium]
MISILITIAVVVVVLGAAGFFVWRWRRPRPLKLEYFQNKWQELQKLLPDKKQWATAIVDADALLDEALRKKRFRGRSMGERMVKAQRLFTDNDSVWFGHKLRNKLDAEPATKLKEKEVKQALLGIRQALKDVGALPNGQPGNTK